MFWVSGISKAIATLLTYPLIRAKAVISVGGATTAAGKGPLTGLWLMLLQVAKDEGVGGLYKGVWMLSYKTVLFNSLMMSFKQKLTLFFQHRSSSGRRIRKQWTNWGLADEWQKKVVLINSAEKPWKVSAQDKSVVYVDGAWSYLHDAQNHFLQEAARRGDYLIVGVHKDECIKQAVGSWPPECFAARLARLRLHPNVTCILEDAPWEVNTDLIQQLGVSKVLSGTMTKLQDCYRAPDMSSISLAQNNKELGEITLLAQNKQSPSLSADAKDPYAECKKMGIYEEVQSLNTVTESDVWLKFASRVFFSNVDASIDWRILATDGQSEPWSQNPGY